MDTNPSNLKFHLQQKKTAVMPKQKVRGRKLCVYSRAKNKALGLAGQAEILIGHLYNLMVKFWVAIVESCTENGQWPAAILSSGIAIE